MSKKVYLIVGNGIQFVAKSRDTARAIREPRETIVPVTLTATTRKAIKSATTRFNSTTI